MASKRMIAKMIVDSDAFLDMPQSTQNLYFHLITRADDDGFIDNPKKIMRVIGSNQNDLEILLSKRYVLAFESGVIVIKHWKLHNSIQKDRYKPTVYQEEYRQLHIKDNGAYTDHKLLSCKDVTPCIQNVSRLDTKCDIDKIRLDKNSIDENIPEILIYWQNLYNKKTATTIIPPETAREQAFKLSQRITDIELLKKCADAFFDDSQDWFFTQTRAGTKTKRVYYFKSFVSNIEALISHVQEKKAGRAKEETRKIPKPPKCPKCGQPTTEYVIGGAGCRACKVVFNYKNDKWVQEGV